MCVTYMTYWATSLFDLAFRWAFRWAKVLSKTRLKSKSEVISLSLSLSRNFGLRPKFRLSERLSERLRRKIRSKYRLRPKLSRTNLTEVGRICMEDEFVVVVRCIIKPSCVHLCRPACMSQVCILFIGGNFWYFRTIFNDELFDHLYTKLHACSTFLLYLCRRLQCIYTKTKSAKYSLCIFLNYLQMM